MKLDEVHYKVHEESLQCAPNWFGSKYQALKHSTTHTVTYGAAFPKFASTKLRQLQLSFGTSGHCRAK